MRRPILWPAQCLSMQGAVDYLFTLGPRLIEPLVVFALAVASGLLVVSIVVRSLRRWARRTTTDLDDIIIAAFRGPARLWVVILALDLAVKAGRLPDHLVVRIDKGLLIVWILSLTIAASRLATSLFRRYGAKLSGAAPVTTLGQNLIRILVASIGILLMFNALGLSITPMLTAMGVGGLAVALGLQETLSNLFAGFFVTAAGNVRIGDYIKLNTGEEGYVADISWRATTLRALANNSVIIPNAKLAQALVTNYSLPEKRMSLLLQVGVSYDSDPDHVERVLLDEATRAAGVVPGLRADPAPFVRFIPGFGDSSLGFTLIVAVEDFVAQYAVQHELRKRIFKRLASEGITIPFPTRTLHVQDQSARRSKPASS